jgi:hypothetical protein
LPAGIGLANRENSPYFFPRSGNMAEAGTGRTAPAPSYSLLCGVCLYG